MILELLGYDWIGVFLLLVGLHFLLDYPLQGDFLATQKSPKYAPRIIPWYHANFAHAAIHGLGVGIILGSYLWAIGEVILHFWIDHKKSMGRFDIHYDQFAHILCKAFWVLGAYLCFQNGIKMW